MHSVSAYRALMPVGLLGGGFLTWLLMTHVFSMAPWEAAVAEDEFQSKVQHVVNSPDGRWTAFLILNRGMDSTHDYELYVQPSGNSVLRRMVAESWKFGPAESLDLRWSADSRQISAFVGAKELTAIVSGMQR
jgi:hypothetical protein